MNPFAERWTNFHVLNSMQFSLGRAESISRGFVVPRRLLFSLNID